MAVEERKYATLEDAASEMANELANTLREAIRIRGKALLAVSGGKTPEKVFKYLHQEKLDWNHVTLTLTDERWVPVIHPDSNEALVRSYLLKYLHKETAFIPLYGGEVSLDADVKSCESRLKTLHLPLDAVYLGIGSDGHFASLFPGDKALTVSDSLCVGVGDTKSRLARISLTAKTILQSRKIYLLFSGDEKHSIYEKAKIRGSHFEIPLRLVLEQEDTPVVVFSAP